MAHLYTKLIKQDYISLLRVDWPELNSEEGYDFCFRNILTGCEATRLRPNVGRQIPPEGKADGAWRWPLTSGYYVPERVETTAKPSLCLRAGPLTFHSRLLTTQKYMRLHWFPTYFIYVRYMTKYKYCWEKKKWRHSCEHTTLHHTVACLRAHDVNTRGGSSGGGLVADGGGGERVISNGVKQISCSFTFNDDYMVILPTFHLHDSAITFQQTPTSLCPAFRTQSAMCLNGFLHLIRKGLHCQRLFKQRTLPKMVPWPVDSRKIV